ncbi:P-loop containing nucleoside triphosphate hydrolase protein [Stemphylium lycopersici]|uniref:P-loop containing nucleoside triphosphate hydrolase protein n=1 Tax=Stemphylium lycopersici TaxID=183478 RepID=A0A364NCG4_STELY|nr:P-loop containing nucleoside triphosphate hydrolase protein [Stemphylium lycopersici]RAR15018.1 P-loop containing nucleoside triphosphate hydrolase protein [Stemphylium lycopersici]
MQPTAPTAPESSPSPFSTPLPPSPLSPASPTSPASPIFFEAASRTNTNTTAQPDSDMLEQLQTPQQAELLDRIDELRSQGLGHHGISLPQLIVCGDQSSGKSSLLEALTRLRFPTGDGMCTNFATEVVLRREAHVEIMCTITPGKSRTDQERRDLAKFRQSFSSRQSFDFLSVTKKAEDKMMRGAKGKHKSIFEDVLRVRYSGPELPSLTIVDLPGLIETELNGGDAAERIAELVTSYMKDEKSILLAVFDSNIDAECHRVLRHLKTFDPKYSRTLGILTKPDRLEPGSDIEKGVVKLAKNERIWLKHQWHVVRNRDFTIQDSSPEVRDEAERKFFANGIWSSIPSENLGIVSLRVKLSRVLLEHISKELPSLVTAVQDAIATTKAGLRALGTARDTVQQQRNYLTGHAEKFQALTNDALQGIYSDTFFSLSSPDEAAHTRLRTEVHNLNIAEFPEPTVVIREDFLESQIGKHVMQSRTSGLPSLVNPSVIRDVFRDQSKNWRQLAEYHLDQVFRAMEDYVKEALGSLMDPYTCGMLVLKQVSPELDNRWRKVEAKLEELLVPYTEQDPITYDPSFVHQLEELRKARYATKGRNQSDASPKAQKSPWLRADESSHNSQPPTQHLLAESMDDYTNSEILDLMQTYYKSAISAFISNIAVLGIENCLIKNLSTIFSPTLIANMDDELLRAIASESEEIRDERASLREKLCVLEAGKQVLSEHIAMRPIVRSSNQKPPVTSRTKAKPARSPTPQAKQKEMEKNITPGHVEDLASQLDNLVVTLPSPSPERLRPRVDSGTSTPVPQKKVSRKRSERSWPPKFDIPAPTVEDTSDDDLL